MELFGLFGQLNIVFLLLFSRTTLHLHHTAESNTFGLQPCSKVGVSKSPQGLLHLPKADRQE